MGEEEIERCFLQIIEKKQSIQDKIIGRKKNQTFYYKQILICCQISLCICGRWHRQMHRCL